MTLTASNCEVHANRLNDPNIDNRVKVAIVTELRDSIEIVQSVEYPRFLAHILPVFLQLLERVPPAFRPDQDNHKLRNIILEIIHRFPHNEALKQYVSELMTVLMLVLRQDNEDNGVLCLKIIVDLHKNYKQHVEGFVQPFLDTVQEMHSNMEKAVEDAFGPDAGADAHGQASEQAGDSGSKKTLPPSLFSFKVLTECPITIAVLFQIHRKFVAGSVPLFVPLIVKVLKLQPPQQQKAHADAEAAGTIFLGMAPDIKNAALFAEFKSLQVKTVSFVAYILRSFTELLKPYEHDIANSVICLMKDCPPDASGTRKELLVATRHLWYTDFRSAFVPHIDLLLNDDLLLTLAQISRIIHIYSRNLHDPIFPPQIQTMCAKLLLSLIDNVVTQESKAEARKLLIRTLDAFATRLGAIHEMFPTVLAYLQRKRAADKDKAAEENFSQLLEMDGFVDLGYVQPIRTCSRPLDGCADLIKDFRTQIKNVLLGIKTTLFALRSHSQVVPDDQGGFATHSFGDEVDIFVRIFKDGLYCFEYFSTEPDGTERPPAPVIPPVAEDKEVLEALASIFTFVDPPIFQEVFATHIQYLFEQSVKNPAVLAIPQYFLANVAVSANFSGLLLSFLVGRLDDLGNSDSAAASVMLRLFKLLFMAVTLFPDTNEIVLRPHLATIIMSSLRMSAKAKDPLNYFSLLRSLFRSIGGGRFELLYQEVLPLLQVLLETLNALLASAHQPHMKELFVELCLTVPVRLSVLLPYLSFLMRPLVIALQAGPDLVSQSLRTLELCVDNLNHEFLEPMLNPVIDDLMNALWKHLKPSPYNQQHSHTTMSILGKFGGRNRRWLKDQSALGFLANPDSALSIDVLFHGSSRAQSLRLDEILAASQRIASAADSAPHLRAQALQFAKACLPILVDFDESSSLLSSHVQSHIGRFMRDHARTAAPADSEMLDAPSQPTQQSSQQSSPFSDLEEPMPRWRKNSIDEHLRAVISVIFACATASELHDQAWPVVEHLSRHFALLAVAEVAAGSAASGAGATSSQSGALGGGPLTVRRAGGSGFDFLNIHAVSRLNGFLEAIIDMMASDQPAQRELAERVTRHFYDSCLLLVGSRDRIDSITAFHILASRFCSSCFQSQWFKKTGGCLGIALLTSKLEMSPKWMLEHEHEFVRALLYVLKDVAADVAYFNLDDATQTLSHVLRVCNSPGDHVPEAERKAKFGSLVSLLMSELANSNTAVRENIQMALQLLADLTGSAVTDILRPVCERLLAPIFAKPLRALPFAIQIGHIDAITYCLSLRPPLLTFNDELLRLLHEALALADAEDQALVSKTSQFKNAVSLNNLRSVCIKLLSAAMACPEFSQPRHNVVRPRIISVFFKSLYSKSGEVVEVANKGLQQVVAQQHKLPKDLLQAGLRPILVNLADHKRLTVSGLEGLARLLKLLTNYFKVEIGRKLLDHLRQWADPKMLEEISGRPLGDIEEIKVIVAILDIFHLLPSPANIFMDDLVKNVLELEQRVHRSLSSPFRKPLIKYLNKYASDAATYFLGQLGKPREAALLFGLVSSPDAAPFSAEIAKSHDELLSTVFIKSEAPNPILFRNGVHLVHRLAALDPSWLLENRDIVERVRDIWRSEVLAPLDDNAYVRGREHAAVFRLLIEYCKLDADNVEMLFDIVEGFLDPELIDTSFIKKFVFEDISQGRSVERRRTIFSRFLELFPSKDISIQRKSCMMRYLITPMLMLSGADSARIVDAEIVESILANMWTPLIADASASSSELDSLKIELLQLTNLLVYRVPDAISESRKDVIKFAWNHLKVEDVTLKQSAYVLLSRFIREYDTPVKIVSQIYVALLRAHQSEGRILVKQALDTLIPVLPTRLANPAGDRVRMPLFVQWIRKIIIEEGHTITQLVSIYQLIIRNADQFYASREHFFPQIVSSLPKLGLSTNATAETRALTLDLAELILRWETRDATESGARKDGMDWSPDAPTGGSSSVVSAPMAHDYKEMVASYLVRFALSLSEPQVTKAVLQRSLDLFDKFAAAWPDVLVKLSQIEKVASSDEDLSSSMVINSVEILRITLEHKPTSWTYSNLASVCKCLESWIRSEQPQTITAIGSIVANLWRALDAHGALNTGRQVPPDETAFFRLLDAVIQQGLRTMSNIQSTVSLLEASCLGRLDRPTAQALLRSHSAEIVKLFNALIRDPSGALPQGPLSEPTVAILKTIILLLDKHISQLGELRKLFIQGILTIIELPDCPVLHQQVLQALRSWIFDTPKDSFPTVKERATVAVKMLGLCKQEGSAIADDYMTLVADIYEHPDFSRSELTVRLETAFMEGTVSASPQMRRRFMSILDRSLQHGFQVRLEYILSIQNWEPLASSFWIRQALELLLGSIDVSLRVQAQSSPQRLGAVSSLAVQVNADGGGRGSSLDSDMQVDEEPLSPALSSMISMHASFGRQLNAVRLSALVEPVHAFLQGDSDLVMWLWTILFSMCWSMLTGRERHDAIKGLIVLLARDYHIAQAAMRPNVVQALLQGVCRCTPPVQLPSQLVRHLGKTYNAWHIALELLQNSMLETRPGIAMSSKEEDKIRESVTDALADLYADLSEEDYFAGLWRRKCLFAETNAAVSYEQAGMWSTAQNLFESAQVKARTGVLPFTEHEYCLWESHWIECAQRLQQWDILTDLAKHDSNLDLLLECAWRLSDWTNPNDRESLSVTLQSISEPPSARKKMFQAFMSLQRLGEGPAGLSDFQRFCDEGIQLVLQRWAVLPTIVSNSHISTFHAFQQFVELQEAAQIQNNLLSTNLANIDGRSQELKGILQTWRERLPNVWDDVNLWSDLVSWRQHVFTIVNKAYLPLIPQISQSLPSGNPTSTYTYRGYHETAWIINRFAHVARKHQLPEVCVNSLSKIYTLPNIEIQEAFYKLREQAKCHLRSLGEHSTGLDVINNTNLLYFTPPQKAEFFILKAMFLSKLNLHEEAVQAFSSAVHIDMTLAKAWAAWGEYNDRMFSDNPTKMEHGVDAVNCYLHAAGLYNSGRSRKFLARILWLLSLDNDQETLTRSYENYKSEIPVWYWITFIPQLILSLTGKEAAFARQILLKIAKSFPQSLHFQLRTAKEDFMNIKTPVSSSSTAQPQQPQPSQQAANGTSGENGAADMAGVQSTKTADDATQLNGSQDEANGDAAASGQPNGASSGQAQQPSQPPAKRQPREIIDETTSLLKTAFPLLALSLETMVDQILQRLKPTTDEDIYRLIVALLSDGVQMYLQQLARDPNDSGSLSAATENNLSKFAESMQPNHLKYKHLFEQDFISSKPNLSQLVERFRMWRDNLERILDRRPHVQFLEHFSHYLAEFEYQKFDEIEVPGQYFELRANNKDFVRIDRFNPTVDIVRGHICCYKSLTIRGHDGSQHRFIVQHPAARHCRRDERILQLFRILNEAIGRKKETRRRNLRFHLPIVVPLAPQIRLVEDDRSNITLQDIYESHCLKVGIHKDDPVIFHINRIRQIFATVDINKKAQKVEILNLKTEIMEEIANKMIPETIVSEGAYTRLPQYFRSRMQSYIDLWTFRKRFTAHLATMTFMTYLMSIGHRHPQKIHISPKTGSVWGSDLLPTISNSTSLFTNNEAVPFRFTPNLQTFLTPLGMEGVFPASIMAVGRSLTEPEFELGDYLSIFVRDELVTWRANLRKPAFQPAQLREHVNNNVEVIVRRAQALSCKAEREKPVPSANERAEPVCRTILDLISQAVNPLKLAQMDIAFMPQL
nr:hypothetical protein HK105_006243 [Polyrhizophydium stewartii]